MSIRTRVMVGTLGLAVLGFVGTLGAAEDGTLIVRDGSVDLNVVNSRLEDLDSENKHKWSKKADTVEVFADASAAEVCTTSQGPPVRFQNVELKVNQQTQDPLTIEARNEGGHFVKKLKLRMPKGWRFAFRAFDFRMVYGTGPQNQASTVTLEQVVVTPEGTGTPTAYPKAPSPETFLCVKFRDN
jgi:hypothetical protein